MPASCKPSDVSWGSYFQSFLMKVPDPCEEYHRTFFTDPTHEVNPFTVLVDMLAVAVFQPLGFIGESVGAFFNNILSKPHIFFSFCATSYLVIFIFSQPLRISSTNYPSYLLRSSS